MNLYRLTFDEEVELRKEYVSSEDYDGSNYEGYGEYIRRNVPGAIEVSYLGGDNFNYIECILFDNEKNLMMFTLKYG